MTIQVMITPFLTWVHREPGRGEISGPVMNIEIEAGKLKMLEIIKVPKPDIDLRELYIAAMFAMYMRAPARKTLPGEIVDLGEIGEVREKNWNKLTPYSPSEPLR